MEPNGEIPLKFLHRDNIMTKFLPENYEIDEDFYEQSYFCAPETMTARSKSHNFERVKDGHFGDCNIDSYKTQMQDSASKHDNPHLEISRRDGTLFEDDEGGLYVNVPHTGVGEFFKLIKKQ